MKTKYTVWTYYQGSTGTRIFEGSKRECNAYIKQEIQKGAKPENMKILKKTKYG